MVNDCMGDEHLLERLLTEQTNSASADLDLLSTKGLLGVMNEADAEVPAAVAKELGAISRAVDAIIGALGRGGSLFYIGAGTSGRLGVRDASECPRTLNVPADLVRGVIAGGDRALRTAVEAVEDDPEAGA